MDMSANFSKRSFFVLILFSLIQLGLVLGAFYYGTGLLAAGINSMPDQVIANQEITDFIGLFLGIEQKIMQWFVPAISVCFAFLVFVQWLVLKMIVNKLANTSQNAKSTKKEHGRAIPKVDLKAKERDEERLFIHLTSILQREGRLIDFLAEDLNNYEDGQIGAAVRSIHEGCKKAVDKYLSPVPVMDKEEGETVTIESGFDPGAVKLTGNVTGNPPFTGVLRHKGWKAEKLNLPSLAKSTDSKIIAPAEVEIE